MGILKFRSRKQKEGYKKPPIPPAVPYKHPTSAHYCFEIVNLALEQDNKEEVAKNLLTWFIVNSSHETLIKFIDWVVNKKEDK